MPLNFGEALAQIAFRDQRLGFKPIFEICFQLGQEGSNLYDAGNSRGLCRLSYIPICTLSDIYNDVVIWLDTILLCLWYTVFITYCRNEYSQERLAGFEPAPSAWKAVMLNH